EAIETMGFRGEALAAISAVSKIELYTRRAEDLEGTFMTLTAGDIDEMEPVGCPAGTSICIRDLFFNTPARQKFLKSDRSEASACVQAGLRCALGRPEISVRILRDVKEEFFTTGDGELRSACYALLGRELASTLMPVQSSDEGLRLSGFISSPAAGRGNRGAQYFYVNGRYIRSALLQTALEQAYKNTLLTGRYPACVICLDIRPGAVDVNVHPAKIEVKFSEENRVFSLLHQAVLGTLHGEDRVTAAEEPRKAESDPVTAAAGSAVPAQDASKTAVPTVSAEELPRKPEKTPAVYETSPVSSWKTVAEPAQILADLPPVPKPGRTSDSGTQQTVFPPAGADGSAWTLYPETAEPGSETEEKEAPVENSVQDVDISQLPNHKIVGEALKTYIIVELEDRILLIDKHAAHERMNFDRLKAQYQPIPAQQLLVPQTLRISAEEQGLLEQFGELFEEFGFEIEPFGEREVILRAVPADIVPEDAVPTLEEILEHLREGNTPDPRSARDELLHTVACKAAIKAGWNTGMAEMERITEEVLSGRVKYCPHGRPVSVTVTRKDLDKLFLRIL
ncbi:MAG: DNA mismatch repair protein MutL, partial [Oscillospiraceae bacterium]|nr:DNA mismatch repair protein MutL [Oscillospiraceae bacterium]